MTLRIGIGYDVHRLVAGRKLMLGGVHIPYDKGLLGHSDADALLHAVCDALLGAAGLGDIGLHFPDNDPEYKDIDSIKLVETVVAIISKVGYDVVNIDCTVIAQAPKISPHRQRMRERISAALSVPPDCVNVKATTTEKLGTIGAGEAIAANCIALIQKR